MPVDLPLIPSDFSGIFLSLDWSQIALSCLKCNNVVGGRTENISWVYFKKESARGKGLEIGDGALDIDVEHKQTNQEVLSFGFVAPNNNSKKEKESPGNGGT